jgi:phospholipid-binding lipoprotein MlaA
MPMRALCRLAALCLVTLLAVGCATIPPDAGKNPTDPWEVYNRHVFEFNERADQYVIKPVAQGYAKVFPEPVRDCIGNIFRNVGDIGNAINNLLQGKAFEASSDICRVAINTTVGLLGCFDVASRVGLTRSNEDFGQTLGKWGISQGPYFVLPLFGPSTVRDSIGRAADIYTDPVSYINGNAYEIAAQSLRVIDLRAQLLQATQLLEGAALDKYQFVRDGYLQRRRNLVYDGNPPREKEPEEPEDETDTPSPPPKPDERQGNSPQKPESKDDKPAPKPDQPAPAPAR